MVRNLFGTRDRFCARQFFLGGEGDWGGDRCTMIQVHCLHCVLYFHYYYISSTSDYQALDPRCWGPLSHAQTGGGVMKAL